MMRRLLTRVLPVLTIVISTATAGWAQSGEGQMSFKQSSHDFGVFHEGKLARWDFIFTNTGNGSLSITSVHAQCGCTTPSYNHKSVAPGKQGRVTIVYDSKFRPGPFDKEVVITTNGTPATVKVTIKGNVLPIPLKGRDVVLIGGIRFSDGTIRLDSVPRDEEAQYILHFQNASPHPIRILQLKHPQDVEAYYPPFTVLTGEMMRVTMTFIPGETRPNGLIRDSLVFKTNDTEKPDKTIYFTAVVVPGKNKKLKSGPELVFKKDFVDLGMVSQHDTVDAGYPFTNQGSDTLHIKSIQTSCGCTVAKLAKRRYAPGESGIIHVSFDAGEKFGDIRKEIMVQSNDPVNPGIQLILRSNVVVHPGGVKGMMSGSTDESIFSGKCRNCHVNKGLGKKGEALFAADCQLCHGRAGNVDTTFHPGPALNNVFLSTLTSRLLFKRIAEGTPDPRKHQMMPGFMKKFGGPLTTVQVKSLVKYLQTIQNSNK